MAKHKATNGAAKVKRLSPAQLVPTAKAGTDKDGNFVVVVTTGRQRETMLAAEAFMRATALEGAAAEICRVAQRVNRANDDEPVAYIPSDAQAKLEPVTADDD